MRIAVAQMEHQNQAYNLIKEMSFSYLEFTKTAQDALETNLQIINTIVMY